MVCLCDAAPLAILEALESIPRCTFCQNPPIQPSGGVLGTQRGGLSLPAKSYGCREHLNSFVDGDRRIKEDDSEEVLLTRLKLWAERAKVAPMCL